MLFEYSQELRSAPICTLYCISGSCSSVSFIVYRGVATCFIVYIGELRLAVPFVSGSCDLLYRLYGSCNLLYWLYREFATCCVVYIWEFATCCLVYIWKLQLAVLFISGSCNLLYCLCAKSKVVSKNNRQCLRPMAGYRCFFMTPFSFTYI